MNAVKFGQSEIRTQQRRVEALEDSLVWLQKEDSIQHPCLDARLDGSRIFLNYRQFVLLFHRYAVNGCNSIILYSGSTFLIYPGTCWCCVAEDFSVVAHFERTRGHLKSETRAVMNSLDDYQRHFFYVFRRS